MRPIASWLQLSVLVASLPLAACSMTYKGTPIFDGRSQEEKQRAADELSKGTRDLYRTQNPEAWARLVSIAPVCDEWDRANRYIMVCVNAWSLIQTSPQIGAKLFTSHWEEYFRRQRLPSTTQDESLRRRWTQDVLDLDRAMKAILLPVLRDHLARCGEAPCPSLREAADRIFLDSQASFEAWRTTALAEAP